jgi:hypothetical protein
LRGLKITPPPPPPRNLPTALDDLDPQEVVRRYNQRFIFRPDAPIMEFAAREPIENGIFAAEKYEGQDRYCQ